MSLSDLTRMRADLLSESYAADLEESRENERTATPVRAFAIHLHQTGCSLRKTTTILASLGVERSHGVVWNWVHRLADRGHDPPTATASRVAVDETAVKINGEWSWLYAAIDIETKLILDVALFGRHGTDSAAAFLHQLTDTEQIELVTNRVHDYLEQYGDEFDNIVGYVTSKTYRQVLESHLTPMVKVLSSLVIQMLFN
ncbi:Transposase and inactivated derivatives-like protein (plasmid) [Haloterrigena turkmenica DSM 5511]|uniref:Transposase and inactivated derivatives-like protein n=1 Tax=Haloterrigena turkmenica (strain ATCC 51198 / DSM 5511 / JCM 9101 / NCIMB 13204 / VKM B-1734 / 4k) TaxID=543526 RepID=D2S2U8_HALTV|nr:DDE-type integrase/transposase/recombinase [Haloterrigena turkmenica]ADB63695.1 Transposase and inactivated derivatives-like protein [Haloterrigena turkmenica DSM 5511]